MCQGTEVRSAAATLELWNNQRSSSWLPDLEAASAV